MRIASLDPALTELVCYFEKGEDLVGISHLCDFPPEVGALPRLTRPHNPPHTQTGSTGGVGPFASLLPFEVDLELLRSLNPDLVVAQVDVSLDELQKLQLSAQMALQRELGSEVKLLLHAPRSVDQMVESFDVLSRAVQSPGRGVKLAHRVKAQFMDWGDNFYERMKNKRVAIISRMEPLSLAGHWVPDLISFCSAESLNKNTRSLHVETSWRAIVQGRPDVILVAPEDHDLASAMKLFPVFEKFLEWEKVLAVKRGEVFFTGGKGSFYRAGPRILDTMAVLISCAAGFESGYITPRDSFYRLRWLEMQRHRILGQHRSS